MTQGTETRTCFVIQAYDQRGNGLFTNILKPAIEAAGLVAVRADDCRPSSNYRLREAMISAIRQADVCLVDAAVNPNVYYEFGIATGARKRTVLIDECGTEHPFDINDFPIVRYDATDPSAAIGIIRSALEKSFGSERTYSNVVVEKLGTILRNCHYISTGEDRTPQYRVSDARVQIRKHGEERWIHVAAGLMVDGSSYGDEPLDGRLVGSGLVDHDYAFVRYRLFVEDEERLAGLMIFQPYRNNRLFWITPDRESGTDGLALGYGILERSERSRG